MSVKVMVEARLLQEPKDESYRLLCEWIRRAMLRATIQEHTADLIEAIHGARIGLWFCAPETRGSHLARLWTMERVAAAVALSGFLLVWGGE